MPRGKREPEEAPEVLDEVVDTPVEPGEPGEPEEIVEEQAGAEVAENDQDGEVDAGEAEYEVDYEKPDGTVSTEVININQLPDILAGAAALQAREEELYAREMEVRQSKDLLAFVRNDHFMKAVTQYRLEGRSELEIAEALYGFYMQNAPEPEDEDVDPRLKAMQQKLAQYDKHFESQAMESARNDNNVTLSQTFVSMGYDPELLTNPRIMAIANQAAVEVFKELAPDVDPNLFTATRKVTPAISKVLWQEVERRAGALMKKKENDSVAPKTLAARVRPLQQRAAAQGASKAPVKLISSKKGVDPLGSRQAQNTPTKLNKVATSSDRRKALSELFHG